MVRRICALSALAGLACLAAHVPVFAQAQAFRAQSDLVVLQVAVHDRHSAPVVALTAADFLVSEDRAPQEVSLFVSEDRPVAVGLAVDNSMSMFNKREEVIAAAEAFARSSNRQDSIFTVNFNERVSFGLPAGWPFTSDLQILHDALKTIMAQGQTAMYDGIAAGLDHLNESPLDQKALIVVSDGKDNRSHLSFDDVFARALRSNAVIYAVGIFDDVEGGDRKALRRLADATGGLAFFPEKVPEITAALDRISVDLRHRYTIGYVSTNTRRDGTFRKVNVVALDRSTRKPLDVRVRSGYVAYSSFIASNDRADH
jgi:Ca-activated chloride channel family protein